LLAHNVRLPDSLARLKAGSSSAARMAIIATTTNSSIKVNDLGANPRAVLPPGALSAARIPLFSTFSCIIYSLTRPRFGPQIKLILLVYDNTRNKGFQPEFRNSKAAAAVVA
jgi:hypothetical protein